jgi:selenide, water dikinase
MRAADQPVQRDLVLIGGGHSHVHVLRSFGMKPMPGVRVTLVCDDSSTPYSGMLPGYVAGHYDYDDAHIDLRRLATFAGATFVLDSAVGLDRDARQVRCRDHPPIPYDLVSLNIGSTPQTGNVPGAGEHAIPVKPIHRFNERWLALRARVCRDRGHRRIAIVGGGAGGVELTLALQYRLSNELRALGRDAGPLQFHLFTASDTVLPTHAARVQRAFHRVLERRGVRVHCSASVERVAEGMLSVHGREHAFDEIVWVTAAVGARWLRDTGLALDVRGFVQVDEHLQSLTDPCVFAAGDIASQVEHPREKAGVFAVRQGPPLARNVRNLLAGRALVRYRPQRKWLQLISTGDRYAIASRGRIGFGGKWVWTWKDWIDRRFMATYNELPAMQQSRPPSPGTRLDAGEFAELQAAMAMRCNGCGAKVGADVLTRALSGLELHRRDDVEAGLDSPDDAAVVRVPVRKRQVHSVDFFRALVRDPYVFGQIAANHALGDIYAMGAEPQSALAIATLPAGLSRKLEDTLRQMMQGAVSVLNAARCALVGGHTGEAAELALGFSVTGLVDDRPDRLLRKSGMRAGDLLILTKPLGTGTLLVADARLAAKGRWIDAALATMTQSSSAAAQCLLEHAATACTDVTGFGLAGHCAEMMRASNADATIEVAALPMLDGALDTARRGMLSSVHHANEQLAALCVTSALPTGHEGWPLLFDPQTAGGLLASVPADRAHACVTALRGLGYAQARVIGRVTPSGSATPRLTVT